MNKLSISLKAGAILLSMIAIVSISSIASAKTSEADLAYIPLQGDHKVLVVNNKTLAPIAMIPTDGQSIDSRLLPDGSKLYLANVEEQKMTVLRAKCPENKADWNEEERQRGECVPYTKLKSVVLEGSGGFYFSVRHDGSIIYVSSITPNPESADAPKEGEGVNAMFSGATAYVNVVDTRTDKVIKRIKPPAERMAIANEISPDGKSLWVFSTNGFAQALDPETGEPQSEPVFVGLVPATAKFSGDGKYLFAANMPPETMSGGTDTMIATLGIVDTVKNELIKTIELTPGSAIAGIEVNSQKKQVWTANANNTLTVVDTQTHEVIKTITMPFSTVMALDISPDGERALVVMFNGPLINKKRGQPDDTSPTYVQLFSTTTFKAISEPLYVGDNSGGIPSLSAE